MTEKLTVEQMAERLQSNDSYLILCHKNPDGDTIGSASALYHALAALGKTAALLCSDTIPAMYAYTRAPLYDGNFVPEKVIAVDVAGVQLLGDKNGVPELTKHIDYCIDHHASNSGFADFTLLDAGGAAAAEIMYQVILALGVEVTPLIADCLYTGLATDTGCFKFGSTSANTHEVAACLIRAGAHVADLNILLFESKSVGSMEAERMARDNLRYYCDGRCAMMHLTWDELKRSGADPADLEALTSLPRSVLGVQVGVTLRQTATGSYRVSVRTVKGIDACSIARRFGGGGHTQAAGCELEGDLENTKAALLDVIEEVLEASTPQEGWF